MVPATLTGQDSQTANQAEARKVIEDGYIEWVKARVAIDKNTFEKMLAPDLYVQFKDRRLTRQQFIDRILSYPPSVTLTGYDASVLTVEPNGDDWVAIILEKLEVERKGADGKGEKEYAAWVTRDGWRKLSSDKWVILFSEEVGQERWKGAPPPLANW
jgi:hypothetical protein